MNDIGVRPFHDGISWVSDFRAADHGEWKPVKVNGERARFRSDMEARLGAHEALLAYQRGRYTSERAKAEHRWEAGKLFRAGKRPVEVVKA